MSQPQQALERANDVRRARKAIRRTLANCPDRSSSLREALPLIDRPPDELRGVTIAELLSWCWGMGPWRMRQLLRAAEISDRRKLGALTPNERARLTGAITHAARTWPAGNGRPS